MSPGAQCARMLRGLEGSREGRDVCDGSQLLYTSLPTPRFLESHCLQVQQVQHLAAPTSSSKMVLAKTKRLQWWVRGFQEHWGLALSSSYLGTNGEPGISP